MATKPEASAGIDPLNQFSPFVPLLDGRPCGPGFVTECGALEYAEQQAMRVFVNAQAGEVLEQTGKTPKQLADENAVLRAALVTAGRIVETHNRGYSKETAPWNREIEEINQALKQ